MTRRLWAPRLVARLRRRLATVLRTWAAYVEPDHLPRLVTLAFITRRRIQPKNWWRSSLMHDPCVYCGGRSETIDHIVPLARNGPDRWENKAPACRTCNIEKSAHPLLLFVHARHHGRKVPVTKKQIVASIMKPPKWATDGKAPRLEHAPRVIMDRPRQGDVDLRRRSAIGQ